MSEPRIFWIVRINRIDTQDYLGNQSRYISSLASDRYTSFKSGESAVQTTQSLFPLRSGEERIISEVDRHGDDHMVEDAQSPFDDIEMAIGDGIKGTQIDDRSFHQDSS